VSGLKRAIVDNYGPTKLLLILGSLTAWFVLTLFLSSQLFRWEPEARIARKAKLYVATTAIPFLLLGIWENKYGRVIAQEKVAVERLDEANRAERRAKQKDQKPDANAPNQDDSDQKR